jgi:hypothetical protein
VVQQAIVRIGPDTGGDPVGDEHVAGTGRN